MSNFGLVKNGSRAGFSLATWKTWENDETVLRVLRVLASEGESFKSMPTTFTWTDPFTGFQMSLTPDSVEDTVAHLADLLERKTATVLQEQGIEPQAQAAARVAADTAADFWSGTYYELLVPLRFTRVSNGSRIESSGATESSTKPLFTSGFRQTFLGPGLPPILPALDLRSPVGDGSPREASRLLASEWALQAAAFATCVWHTLTSAAGHQGHSDRGDSEGFGELAALRIGILLSPLWNAVKGSSGTLAQILDRVPLTARIVDALQDGNLSGLGERVACIVQGIRSGGERLPPVLEELRLRLVVCAAQRVKQFVFDSSRLREIRGASILLDETFRSAADQIAWRLGRECVLRDQGSTLIFLAPASAGGASTAAEVDGLSLFAPPAPTSPDWPLWLFRYIHSRTGAARVALGCAELSAAGVFTEELQRAVAQAYRNLEDDRNRAEEPGSVRLPFERLCESCGRRAASTVLLEPEGQVCVCPVCEERGEVGRKKRPVLVKDVWNTVVGSPQEAGEEREVAPSIDQLVPQAAYHQWVGLVYGDGDDFGQIIKTLSGFGEQVHWSRRIALTLRAMVWSSLVEATQDVLPPGERADGRDPAGAPRDCYPFEILSLGGDDVAFLAWAPVAFETVRRALRRLDAEFQPDPANRASHPRVTFSFGIAVAPARTAARYLYDAAEKVLLKEAKRARRERSEQRAGQNSGQGSAKESVSYSEGGAVTFWVAVDSEELPRLSELWKETVGAATVRGSRLSLQPLSASQLDFLVSKARGLAEEGYVGALSRLTAPFFFTSPAVALLNYRYNRARHRGGGIYYALEGASSLAEGNARGGVPPLLDLLQLAKVFHNTRRPAERPPLLVEAESLRRGFMSPREELGP